MQPVTGIALVTGRRQRHRAVGAVALAGAGFTVVLAGRRPAPLEEAAAEAGNRAVAADV